MHKLNGLTQFDFPKKSMKLHKKIAATANIFDGKTYGDFPVHSKLIICKA